MSRLNATTAPSSSSSFSENPKLANGNENHLSNASTTATATSSSLPAINQQRQQQQQPPMPCDSTRCDDDLRHRPGRRKLTQEQKEEALKRHDLPATLPSPREIREALPSHVFESSAARSLFYVVKDVVQIAMLLVVGDWLWWWSPWTLLTWLLMPVYWLLQGTLFWALFVLGHDAGHASFSRHALLNDCVGNVLHGFLLCPYYCWKLSHRKHHAFTGNMDRDEVFYPIRQSDAVPSSCIVPLFGFGASWFAYLFNGYRPRKVNHFDPRHPMFSRHVAQCVASIAVVVLWACCLLHLCFTLGLWRVLALYGVPEFVFASYLVLTTFLHHTETHVPWYDDATWDFVRGQLSSIDRHYGWCHDLVHNIGTHQIHHLFSEIPHYHLEEATVAFRRRFPNLVRKSDERLLPAFVRMFYTWCSQRVVPDSTLVHVYK